MSKAAKLGLIAASALALPFAVLAALRLLPRVYIVWCNWLGYDMQSETTVSLIADATQFTVGVVVIAALMAILVAAMKAAGSYEK